jgi:signal transduction histidine kinase
MLESMRSSADSLIRIVNDGLGFSKISDGKVKFEETDFDLVTVVKSVIAPFDAETRPLSKLRPLLTRMSPRHCAATRYSYASANNLVSNVIEFTYAAK